MVAACYHWSLEVVTWYAIAHSRLFVIIPFAVIMICQWCYRTTTNQNQRIVKASHFVKALLCRYDTDDGRLSKIRCVVCLRYVIYLVALFLINRTVKPWTTLDSIIIVLNAVFVLEIVCVKSQSARIQRIIHRLAASNKCQAVALFFPLVVIAFAEVVFQVMFLVKLQPVYLATLYGLLILLHILQVTISNRGLLHALRHLSLGLILLPFVGSLNTQSTQWQRRIQVLMTFLVRVANPVAMLVFFCLYGSVDDLFSMLATFSSFMSPTIMWFGVYVSSLA